jgi:polar amino acid transport system substrate-binding protein
VGLIELIYVAAPGQTFADANQVDRPGVKVGVIQGDPSDRYLSLDLKSAEIVRIPLNAHISDDVIELLRSGKSDVFGTDSGVGSSVIKGLPGAKIVGAFDLIRVAVSLPKGRSSAAQAKLTDLINEAKRPGLVQGATAQPGRPRFPASATAQRTTAPNPAAAAMMTNRGDRKARARTP